MVVLAGLMISMVEAGAQKTPSSLLWRISGNGLDKPSFLYGTIHLSDKRLFYFGDSLYHYLEQADGFDMEIDADSMINAVVRKWSQADNGRFLKSLMEKKDYKKWAGKLSKTLGKPADKITTRDVWLAKNRQTADAYKKGDMSSFMDLYLYGIAKKQGKLVGGIEDVEDQLSLMDDLFDELDLAYLTQDAPRETGMGVIEKMKEIYLKQDLDEIESFTASLTNQKFKDAVLMRRNLKMARRMDSLARERSSFFAVGVAHLPGDTGVIDLLRKKGFRVDPVFSSKKIAPENYTYKTVDKPWKTFTHDLNLYHVNVPGLLQPLDMMKEVMDMEFYYDMAGGKVYYTAVVNTTAGAAAKDSVFAAMIGRMSSSGDHSLVSQKTITKQGWEGRDVVMKGGADQMIRLNVYMADGYAYMAMMLTKKADLNEPGSKRFFESFTMTPGASVARPYIDYRDTAMAFCLKFPAAPSVQEQPEREDGTGEVKVYSSTDYSSGNSYSLTVTNTKAGNYVYSDTGYLRQVKTSLVAIMNDDTVARVATYQGYPALLMSGPAKAENLYYRTITVLRGNRSYFLVAQSKGPQPGNKLIDSFMHSFQLTGYSRGDWQLRTASDGSFTAWVPPAARTGTEDEDAAADSTLTSIDMVDELTRPKNLFLFHDKATGTSYNVQRISHPVYYFSRNDSSFFSQAAERFETEGDSTTRFRLVTIGNDKAADMLMERPFSSIVKKLRFILHGDTLYEMYSYIPRWLLDHENTRQFFERFSPVSPSQPTSIFTNKTARLVADLGSTDSTAFTGASEYIYKADLQQADLPAFYPLLIRPLKDFSVDGYSTNRQLIESIAPVADSTTVNFVLQHFDTLHGKAQQLQYPLLELLVRMNQPYATASAVKLFNAAGIPGGDPGTFAAALKKHLPLARTLFPRISQLSKDTSTVLEWSDLLLQLLDSGHISKQDLLPLIGSFIAAAANQEKGLGKDDYNYKLSGAVDLFGTLNTPLTNAKLQQYSRLANADLSYEAICWLINNKQPLPAPAIAKLAQLDNYRTDLYDTLKSAGKAGMFPAAQFNQKLFAASYLRGSAWDDDDESPEAVQWISEKTAFFKGKKQKFYLFKVSFGEGEDANRYLGIAGPFSLHATPVTSKNEATGVFWNEPYSRKDINKHFLEYLAKLEGAEEDQ